MKGHEEDLLDRAGKVDPVTGTGLNLDPGAGFDLDRSGHHDRNGGEAARPRPTIQGKFLFLEDRKLYVRGVTYGTFRPNREGSDVPDPLTVERDFAQMAASGINCVRTYKVPPRWLLDIAEDHGLLVMVGLAWEQHVAFLDDRSRPGAIEKRLRAGVRACAGHPAVLCYAVGNEIPTRVVRWHGRHRVERFLRRLYDAAKEEDPTGLVTYVNYPSTEYLQLPFLDILCFNVYLEEQRKMEAYLARLHNIAGDRPLVMAEIGLDSRRHGEQTQADVLTWQVETAFQAGCAGAFVFAWTDEWHVTYLDGEGRGHGGSDIEDWDFGLTDRLRRPKLALAAVRRAFAEVPLPQDLEWPRVSVVVCSLNGERTLRDCFDGLLALEYPDFEVIVVDDGSTDATAAIAQEYGFRVITTENRGLASARNTGMAAGSGEIVAYLDDDARPDPHWLSFLAASFLASPHAGIGGPNVEHPGDGPIAACVTNAPGGPVHVLLSDREAEHLPGCNAAFRKASLEAVGGFDPRFRAAGDDVDLCWRLRDRGWTLGFSPGAVVWHHRRPSVRGYWRQQVGYGRAEALLERKWPEKYNLAGHLTWTGRLYGDGAFLSRLRRRARIYHGTWGSEPFQSIHQRRPGLLAALPSLPEWYLVIGLLAALSFLGAVWRPLFLFLPLLGLAVGALLAQAVAAATQASFATVPRARRLKLRSITALLYLLQPLARLWGRAKYGLTPWRGRGRGSVSLPRSRTWTIWSESWQPPEKWLGDIEAALREGGATVLRGGSYDRWDLEVRGGALGSARVRALIEEHGGGQQLVRLRCYPRSSAFGFAAPALLTLLSVVAVLDGAWAGFVILASAAIMLVLRQLQECAGATAEVLEVAQEPRARPALPSDLRPQLEQATTGEP
ncbi:MAG: glycosyltransferase [Actinomycetota bacterium]